MLEGCLGLAFNELAYVFFFGCLFTACGNGTIWISGATRLGILKPCLFSVGVTIGDKSLSGNLNEGIPTPFVLNTCFGLIFSEFLVSEVTFLLSSSSLIVDCLFFSFSSSLAASVAAAPR